MSQRDHIVSLKKKIAQLESEVAEFEDAEAIQAARCRVEQTSNFYAQEDLSTYVDGLVRRSSGLSVGEQVAFTIDGSVCDYSYLSSQTHTHNCALAESDRKPFECQAQ